MDSAELYSELMAQRSARFRPLQLQQVHMHPNRLLQTWVRQAPPETGHFV
jgi:hypothetical protein